MPYSMLLASERPGSKNKRVLISEPFPAFNTTDAFIADSRTVRILKGIFKKYKITERLGIDLTITKEDEEWGMPNEDNTE